MFLLFVDYFKDTKCYWLFNYGTFGSFIKRRILMSVKNKKNELRADQMMSEAAIFKLVAAEKVFL